MAEIKSTASGSSIQTCCDKKFLINVIKNGQFLGVKEHHKQLSADEFNCVD